jgi:tRNA(Arg) A34 adenosine deaminase TadA
MGNTNCANGATTNPSASSSSSSSSAQKGNEKSFTPPLTASASDIKKMLETIENAILPKTREGVANGNKVFGAAILSDEFNLRYADTNNEIKCPLLHGEVNTIMEWSKQIPSHQFGSAAKSSIFLSTHEPCCMCISSIVWAGFNTVYYFLPYAVTTDQGIPWDVETMHELWGVQSYQRQNKFCKTACIMDLIQQLPEDNHAQKKEKRHLIDWQDSLKQQYNDLANHYHTEKESNKSNSLVMN